MVYRFLTVAALLGNFGGCKTMAKKKKARKKKMQKELTVTECIENLLAAHTLQGAWLRKLKESMRSKKENGR